MVVHGPSEVVLKVVQRHFGANLRLDAVDRLGQLLVRPEAPLEKGQVGCSVFVFLFGKLVVAPSTITTSVHHPCVPQNVQVTADHRLRDLKGFFEMTDAQLTMARQGRDSKLYLVTQRPEESRAALKLKGLRDHWSVNI